MTIKGTVKEVRYASDESGYCIIVLECDDFENIVAVGTFPAPSAGESLSLEGDFVVHKRFGRQFKAEAVKRETPTSLNAMTRYLGGGLIKGVGPKTAGALSKMFGLKTLEIIEHSPVQLAKIKGITRKKAQQIHDEFMKHRASEQAIMFLQDKGIALKTALKIFKKYGENTVALVRENPYALVEDIDGIGFVTADGIAQRLGVKKDSPYRLRAGLIHALKESSERNGHTFLFRGELTESAAKLLALHKENIENPVQLLGGIISDMAVNQKLKILDWEDGGEAVFLRGTYLAENNAATKLVSLMNNSRPKTADISGEIEDYQRVYGIDFNGQQKDALKVAVENGVSVITGGPGTGKTTIIKCLLSLLNQRGLKCMLMAPTGRAAKRMSESTGHPASTIHRAILRGETGGTDSGFLRQLECDAVIVDEVSMMDIFLLNNLLKCVREGSTLVFLGDNDQLPSVGAGSVLKDLLERLPSVRLTQIYRQGKESGIIASAHRINQGEMPDLSRRDWDFFFIKEGSQEKIADVVTELVSKRLPAYLDVSSDKIQVLCPMKNGPAGTININRLLAAALNTSVGGEIKAGGETLRCGDRVMQTVNNYEQTWKKSGENGEGVFNGDIGVIADVRGGAGEIDVLFEDGRKATYTQNIDELILAYAITVHKSQGSEFDAVVLPLVPGSPMIITRNLLYTAVSRAKRLCVLVGEEYLVKKMVSNNYIAGRNSGLKRFVDEAGDNYRRLFGE